MPPALRVGLKCTGVLRTRSMENRVWTERHAGMRLPPKQNATTMRRAYPDWTPGIVHVMWDRARRTPLRRAHRPGSAIRTGPWNEASTARRAGHGVAATPSTSRHSGGGRILVGPTGRGVPREEPAAHFAGRQPAGRVRRVDLERTVAGSRGFSCRRGPCPTDTGPSPARQHALSLSTVGGRFVPGTFRAGRAHGPCWSRHLGTGSMPSPEGSARGSGPRWPRAAGSGRRTRGRGRWPRRSRS
jgi:hypothetical protein